MLRVACRDPDNVVGSYAVYHASKRDNYTDRHYRTGKAFHVYRPELIDANGQRVWADMHIDAGSNLLTITMPAEWLATAAYPVVVDPTFGYTGIGALPFTQANDRYVGVKGTPASDGTVDSISFYASGANATKGVLINDSAKAILTNGVSNRQTPGVGADWVVATYTSKPSVTGGTLYYPGVIPSNNITMYSDGGAANDEWFDSSNSYATPTNPSDGSGFAFLISIYATYTAASSGRALLLGGRLVGGGLLLKGNIS